VRSCGGIPAPQELLLRDLIHAGDAQERMQVCFVLLTTVVIECKKGQSQANVALGYVLAIPSWIFTWTAMMRCHLGIGGPTCVVSLL